MVVPVFAVAIAVVATLVHVEGMYPPPTAGDPAGCECPPDVIGQGCKVKMFKTAAYFPKGTAVQRPCNYREVRDMKAALDALQRPSDGCRPSKMDAYRLPAYGFGSIFSYAVYGMHRSLLRGRMFEATPHSLQGFSEKSCAKQSFQCYLKPWSPCSPSTSRASEYTKKGRDQFQKKKFAKVTYKGVAAVSFLFDEDRAEWTVPKFAEARGLFWYHAQLTNYMWQLNLRTQRAVGQIADDIAMPKARARGEGGGAHCIALHVRHGDSCADHRSQRKCHPLAAYMVHVSRMGQMYGIKTVYLATDDAKVVKEARAGYGKDFKFATAPVDRQFYENKRRIESRMQKMSGKSLMRAGMEAVVDIELMSRCHAFVGTFSTNLGRIAFELMAARRGYVPPFASLDISWCAGFDKKNKPTYSSSGKMVPFDC